MDFVNEVVKLPLVSWLGGMLVGIFVGVAGKYYADKYTDQRKGREKRADLRSRFGRCKAAMPELIAEMKQDVTNTIKSEFVLLDIHLCYGGFPDKPLAYHMDGKSDGTYRDEKRNVMVHAQLLDKVKMLENNGFLFDISRTSVPYFRMTDDFVQLLKDD